MFRDRHFHRTGRWHTAGAGATDTTAPTISGVIETPGSTTATISWNLDEPATGYIEYGTTTAYGSQTTFEDGFLTYHSQDISGLTAGTTYYYRIVSGDASGNVGTYEDSFDTTGSPAAFARATWGNGLAALENSSGQAKQNLELQNGWCSYRFTAWESSDIEEVRIGFTNRTTSYGGGNGGRYRCAIVNNGPDGLPGSTVYGFAETDTAIVSSPDAFNAVFTFSSPVAVTAGTKYHLYITNVDPSPTSNWSSINNPWNINHADHPIYEGEDTEFLAASSHYSTSENDSRASASAPAFDILYDSGNHQGHSANRGANDGEGNITSSSDVQWLWTHYGSDITFDAVGIYLWKISGSTNMTCTVKKNGSTVATGTFTTSGALTAGNYTDAEWVEATLSGSVTATAGDTMQIDFETSAGEYRCQVLLCSAYLYDFAWRLLAMPYDGNSVSRHQAKENGSFIWSNWSSHTVLSSYVRLA